MVKKSRYDLPTIVQRTLIEVLNLAVPRMYKHTSVGGRIGARIYKVNDCTCSILNTFIRVRMYKAVDFP